MPDIFQETDNVSWFGRIGDSIKGIVFGLIFIGIAFLLLFWNEGRAVKTARSLDEGQGVCIAADAADVSPGNEGKLIHLTGTMIGASLTDPDFGITQDAVKLVRNVSVYQWKESEKTETEKHIGGSETQTKTYTYEKTWSDKLIDSSNFKHGEGHENPPGKPVEDLTLTAPDVKLGAYSLSPGLVRQIPADEPVAATPALIEKLSANLKDKVQAVNGTFYLGNNPKEPIIGDAKIRFTMAPPGTVSLIARQTGSALGPFPTKAGDSLEMLRPGTFSADQMFTAAKQSNAKLTWILRLVGLIVMWIGLASLLAPFKVLADVIPFLGDIVGIGIGLAAGLVAAVLSLVTIAIAWITFRPVLGIALLAAAAAVLAGLFALRRKRVAVA